MSVLYSRTIRKVCFKSRYYSAQNNVTVLLVLQIFLFIALSFFLYLWKIEKKSPQSSYISFTNCPSLSVSVEIITVWAVVFVFLRWLSIVIADTSAFCGLSGWAKRAFFESAPSAICYALCDCSYWHGTFYLSSLTAFLSVLHASSLGPTCASSNVRIRLTLIWSCHRMSTLLPIHHHDHDDDDDHPLRRHRLPTTATNASSV